MLLLCLPNVCICPFKSERDSVSILICLVLCCHLDVSPTPISAHLILLRAYMSADVRQTWHSIYLFVYPVPHMPTLPLLDVHHQRHCLTKNNSLCGSRHWSGCPLSLHTPRSLPFSSCSYAFHLFTWHFPRSSHFSSLVLHTAELICPVKFFLSFAGFTNSSESWN